MGHEPRSHDEEHRFLDGKHQLLDEEHQLLDEESSLLNEEQHLLAEEQHLLDEEQHLLDEEPWSQGEERSLAVAVAWQAEQDAERPVVAVAKRVDRTRIARRAIPYTRYTPPYKRSRPRPPLQRFAATPEWLMRARVPAPAPAVLKALTALERWADGCALASSVDRVDHSAALAGLPVLVAIAQSAQGSRHRCVSLSTSA